MTDIEASTGVSVSSRNGRSFFSSSIEDFLRCDPRAIIGQLSSRHVGFHAAAEADQVRAWEREIEVLTASLANWERSDWHVLLEVPLLRLGKRLDAVILGPDVVVVLEFKIGAQAYNSADRLQVEHYAQSLRDFHEVSQTRKIVPILCAERAPARPLTIEMLDGVAEVLLTNATLLGEALLLAVSQSEPSAKALCDPVEFDLSPYRPTPTIVEAAQALYAGHRIADIGRGDAADMELQAAGDRLRAIAAEAEATRSRIICFVTGAPGAGKTLLGLDLALKSRSGTQPATLLSGNRPLVHVLSEALSADSAARTGRLKAVARYEADTAIQNLLGFLKEHTDGATPPEHVIIFDEAQRAWDETVGQELMGRPKSEPELFLDILDRLDWACLVCLVGPGQEINRGEGGLSLWGEALARSAERGRSWRIVAAPEALDGGPDVPGAGLFGTGDLSSSRIVREPQLHLANAIRSYRNPLHGKWVAALLEGEIARAKDLCSGMAEPPAYVTRDLVKAKDWLRQRRRGGRSVGMLASSGAVRLIGDGIPPAPRSNELGSIGHWFLKPWDDFRSSSALETPMSEFGCQGLELDYVCLCWGGDLIWSGSAWRPRMMRAPRWRVIREPQKHQFRLNGYRVLLTRGRAGCLIFVPPGDEDDPTRSPQEADEIAAALSEAGCESV